MGARLRGRCAAARCGCARQEAGAVGQQTAAACGASRCLSKPRRSGTGGGTGAQERSSGAAQAAPRRPGCGAAAAVARAMRARDEAWRRREAPAVRPGRGRAGARARGCLSARLSAAESGWGRAGKQQGRARACVGGGAGRPGRPGRAEDETGMCSRDWDRGALAGHRPEARHARPRQLPRGEEHVQNSDGCLAVGAGGVWAPSAVPTSYTAVVPGFWRRTHARTPNGRRALCACTPHRILIPLHPGFHCSACPSVAPSPTHLGGPTARVPPCRSRRRLAVRTHACAGRSARRMPRPVGRGRPVQRPAQQPPGAAAAWPLPPTQAGAPPPRPPPPCPQCQQAAEISDARQARRGRHGSRGTGAYGFGWRKTSRQRQDAGRAAACDTRRRRPHRPAAGSHRAGRARDRPEAGTGGGGQARG